jgi:ankyrin repeat protein
VISATEFVGYILVPGKELPQWKSGDLRSISVRERDVQKQPLRQGEPLSGFVIASATGGAELAAISSRQLPNDEQGPLASRQNRAAVVVAAPGENYASIVPGFVCATLNWFAGLKYECLLVDTEHQEFCRDCSGAVLDFIKPPKDADAAALARLRLWLPRLSNLVAKAPIPQRLEYARDMARLCFTATVAVPGSPAEIERLTAIRECVLALLRHDEWPSTVEVHFNPVAESAAMGDAFAVVRKADLAALEVRFNELVDRCLDDMIPHRAVPRARSEGPRDIAGPIPLLVHLSVRPAMCPLLVWAWQDMSVSQLLAEVATRMDVHPSDLTGLSLVLRRGSFEMALAEFRALQHFDLVAGDHLWLEEAWNTPAELVDSAEQTDDVMLASEMERGLRHVASWKSEDGTEWLSLTYFIRISKVAARYPLVLSSPLPDPLAGMSPEDRRLMEERLVGVKQCTDPMEAYLAHLNYWMDVRSPSGALHRGMLLQPEAFVLNMDEPQTPLLMSQHEVRERIVYGEWDVDSEDSSSADDSDASDDADDVASGDEGESAQCEGCKFDMGGKQWTKCDQCGLVNARARSKGLHLSALPDRNTVAYWNKEWAIASAKQYELRKRILSLSKGEVWIERLRSYIREGKNKSGGSVALPEEGEEGGKFAFRVRMSDTEPYHTQEVVLSAREHFELEPLDVHLSLSLTTQTGAPVSIEDLWVESPESEPRRYVWIFGDPGSGKTWLSRHLCTAFNQTKMLSQWRRKFDAVIRVFLPDLLRSCSQYGDLITSKELLDAAWALCSPSELGLNTVRVGSAYERCTERILWILDGYDEAERMLDLENRRPGTNYRFMQGLASGNLYYLQNAIVFTRSMPELELTGATRLMLKGIAADSLEDSRVLVQNMWMPFRFPESGKSAPPAKGISFVSWEDVDRALQLLAELGDDGNATREQVLELGDAIVSMVVDDNESHERLMAWCAADTSDLEMAEMTREEVSSAEAMFKAVVERFGPAIGDTLKDFGAAAADPTVELFTMYMYRIMKGVVDAMLQGVDKDGAEMMPIWLQVISEHLHYVVQIVCKVPKTEVRAAVSRLMAASQWRRPRSDLLYFVEQHVIRGVTREERLRSAKEWVQGWQKVPAIAALLSNPLHVQLLCRVQRTRPDNDEWYSSPELPLEPRELLISELHRHAITPILLRKENFDFAAGTVFGELELIKAHVADEKNEKAAEALENVIGFPPLLHRHSASEAEAATAVAAPVAAVAEAATANGTAAIGAAPAVAPSPAGLPRDSIDSQSVREFLMSLWYMANPNNHPPLPRPSSKDQRWLFLLCLTPPSERWTHVLAVATRLKDRILRSKSAGAVGGPEDVKSLGSPDALTLLELLRVAHALDRNSSNSDHIEPVDVSLFHMLREVIPDEQWLNSPHRGLVALPPIPATYSADSGFWLCRAPYRHHSASVRMKVPSVVSWSASFHLLPPPPGSAPPKGVAFSPATSLDHLLVDHNIQQALIRPQSIFDTGAETGFVFGGWSLPNLCDAVVSPASESPADWPMCWSCGDVTVDGIACRLCRRQHHALCARSGRKLLCCQCSHSYVCNFYTEAKWCPRCGSDKLCHVNGANVAMPFCCVRCRVMSLDDKSDPPPFVQEVFLQAAASMGLRAVVLACLHPAYRPKESTERWASAAFQSASLHGHQELAEEVAKLFSSSSVATNLMRGVLRYRAARGLPLEKYSQYSLLFFSSDAHGSTPLHLAALRGHAETVSMLLRKSQNPTVFVNAATTYGSTALHEAALQGSAEVLELLLAAGANPDAKNRLGETALHLALSQGHARAFMVLAEHAPHLMEVQDAKGNTPIHTACAAGFADGVRMLVFGGADIHSLEVSPLHVACASDKCSPLLASVLLRAGLRPLSIDKSGKTALSIAVKQGLTEVVGLMMKEVQCTSQEEYWTACVLSLAEACRSNRDDIVELLTSLPNVPLNETSVYGAPPLVLACRSGSLRMVKLLLAAGARTNVSDNRGNFPIHAACLAGDADIAEVLMEQVRQERHLFTSNDELLTPLHLACRWGFSRIVRLLVGHVERELERQNVMTRALISLSESPDPGVDPKPKRGRSSFILFVTAMRSHALEQHPELTSNKELMNLLQEMWGALPPAEQQVYEDMAAEEKKTQDALIAAWTQASQERLEKASPPPPKDLISSFMALCPRGPGGVTPLHLAAVNGRHECVVLMLSALMRSGDSRFRLNINSMVTTPDRKDTFTLTEVCTKGYHRIAALLLDCGPGSTFVNRARLHDLRTPLHQACVEGSAPTVRVLLERGGDVVVCDKERNTALQLACMRRSNESVIRMLVEHGADMDLVQGFDQISPLQWCCVSGPAFATNALALLQHKRCKAPLKPMMVQSLHDWMGVELERLRLHEEEDEDGAVDENGVPLAGLPEDETPLSGELMLQLLWRASQAAEVPMKPSSLPVKLVLQATQGSGFRHCLAWLRQFVGAVRVDPELIAEAKLLGVPPDVLAFVEDAQKKQLENIKSSFLPDAASAKQKQVASRNKPKKKNGARKK